MKWRLLYAVLGAVIGYYVFRVQSAAVAVLVALGLRYVVGQMARAAQKYHDALIRDEIESARAWLERQRQPPHG